MPLLEAGIPSAGIDGIQTESHLGVLTYILNDKRFSTVYVVLVWGGDSLKCALSHRSTRSPFVISVKEK